MSNETFSIYLWGKNQTVMTIGGFFIVLFFTIGLYGLFKKDDCNITEEDIDDFIHELEEEKKNLKPHSTKL